MNFLQRQHFQEQITLALKRAPVVAIVGPRQCGKSTIARQIVEGFSEKTWLDLESPADLLALENPQMFLNPRRGLVVLDEIQHRPDLFPLLRVLADRPEIPARFLILGSSSPELLRDTSESLAGRVEFIEMTPFDLAETGPEQWRQLWERGGFPRSYLADSDEASAVWRENFIQTFLTRDVLSHGIDQPPAAMRRFWAMLTHYHGQVINFAELARGFGASERSVRKYVDILTGGYMIRQLQPWHENLAKRQVKSPKLYFRDSGLLHSLLGTRTADALWSHPKIGASWEGFMLEETLRALRPADAWFWATHGGVELDLMCVLDGRRHGFEFKWSERPTITRSMRAAVEDLKLRRLWIVYPGERRLELEETIHLLPPTDVPAIS